jgi:hypothetical protein
LHAHDSNQNTSDFENFLKKFTVSPDNCIEYSPFRKANDRTLTWTSPDGETHNQVDHMFIDKGWHSSILNVRYFRGADYDSDHDGMVTKVRKKVAVSKQAAEKFDLKTFNLSNLTRSLVNGAINLRVL